MRKCDLFNRFLWNRHYNPPPLSKKLALLAFLVTMFSFSGVAQTITLKAEKQPLLQVLKQVRKQTGYDFAFSSNLVQKAKPVTVTLHQIALANALTQIFEGQPFTYEVKEKRLL
ncbi:STN domain-containing protein [Niabella sp. W65]|nr:STN domain-containing protein [Niabella sp. W65]MCH7364089.1 STN domain-containing protein [Niabella sp. W65]ULT39966.1 STN domain-containing protein [Niabella sp. I65]